MEYGEFEPFLKRRQRRGKRSAILDSRPEIRVDLSPVWRAFMELSATRAISMVPNPIRPVDVVAWLDLHCVSDPTARLELWELILALDVTWLRIQAEKRGNTKAAH